MIRKAVSGLGRTLVTSGVILLLFVVYQLWGTGINAERDQTALKKDLGAGGFDVVPADVLAGKPNPVTNPINPISTAPASVPFVADTDPPIPPTDPLPTSVTPVSAPTSISAVPTSVAPPVETKPPVKKFGKALISKYNQKAVPLKSGEAIGQLVIPKIHVDKAIVQGTSVESLKKGPGHYKTTPFPGEAGNSAIACHRTTYSGPCFRLDELVIGDSIFVARRDANGQAQWFRYDVYQKLYVKPSKNDVLLPQDQRNTLTLTTCHPQYSAKQRLVVHAELVGPAVESELFDIQDPLAAEYQAQIDARTRPAATTPTKVVATAATTVAPTSSSASEAAPQPTTIAPTASTLAPTTIDVDPSTIFEPAVDSADDRATTNPGTEVLPGEEAPKPPTFDGERSSGTLHKFLFFNGTAAAWLHSLAWALVCGAIWLAVWLVASKRKALLARWGTYAVCFFVLFVPALYFCFENVSRLLPEAV